MARRIATVGGYAIRPGVSRNGRLYTKEMIAKAVERAQARIAESGGMPVRDLTADDTGRGGLTQFTHHEAEKDSTRIVGRVTSLTLTEDGSARFTADIADTPYGQTIASLVEPHDPSDPDSVPPFLKGVSIRGSWVGRVRRQKTSDGSLAETAEGLTLDGLDYTGKPGVPGSEIDQYARAAGAPAESDGRVLIYESVQEATVTAIEETATTKPHGDVQYADNGYQKDGQKRYPLDSKAHAKSAWSYINQQKNARLYTANQLKRIKQRIKVALKKYGVEVNESWLIDAPVPVTESMADTVGVAAQAGSFCVSLTNGPVTVTVSSYCVDPHDLDAIGRAAMDGACKALEAIDPDMDGDMDVPGAPAEDTDDDMGESAPESSTVTEAEMPEAQTEQATEAATPDTPAPQENPAPDPVAADEKKEEPAVSEPTQAATQPAADKPDEKANEPSAMDLLSAKFDKFTDVITGLVSKVTAPVAVESAPAAPVTESQSPKQEVTESEDERISRLVSEGIAKAMPQAVANHVETYGPPTRKGLVRPVTESDATGAYSDQELPAEWPQKPLHEYTTEERKRFLDASAASVVFGNR